LRTVLSVAISGVLQEYTTRHRLPARTIAGAGILFGFSFFLLATALLARSLWLFTGGVALATVAVALGSTDPDKCSTDDITYTPRRDYGLMYNIGPEFQQQARDAASAARALWQPVAHAGAKEKAPAEKAKPSPVSAPAG